MGSIAIRPAVIGDADSIAHVHVEAWRETYHGMMPASVLGGLSVERRAQSWRRMLSDLPPANEPAVFVAVDGDDGVIGFGCYGRQRDTRLDSFGFDGEFQAIYLLAAAKRQGAGSRLMMTMAASMLTSGYRGGSLWVLRDNHPARRFYEALGGKLAGEREERRNDDLVLIEVAYGWPDLGVLAGGRRSATNAYS